MEEYLLSRSILASPDYGVTKLADPTLTNQGADSKINFSEIMGITRFGRPVFLNQKKFLIVDV